MKRIFSLLWALATAANFAVAGQVIDFETLPDNSVPYDGMVVSNQWASWGVTFRLANGGLPIIATPGGTNLAFWGPPDSSQPNLPAPGQNVGRFFLVDRQGGAIRNLFVEYSAPVSAASGVLLDIDHKDAWSIEPRDIDGNTFSNYVVTLDTNNVNTGDGIATPWSIQMPSAQIYAIRFHYIGDSISPGLALDNLSPTNALPVPAPASLSVALNATNTVVTIAGTPSGLYRLEASATLGSSNWSTLTNVYLPSTPFIFVETRTTVSNRFYRAVGVQ